MILFKHRRSAERDAFSVPRSVQKSIPIKRIVPISNELPKNTELYRLMSTKPGED